MYLIFAARQLLLLYNAHLSTTAKATKASPKIASQERSVKQQTVWTILDPYRVIGECFCLVFVLFFYSCVLSMPQFAQKAVLERVNCITLPPLRPPPQKRQKNVCGWVMTSSYRPPVYLCYVEMYEWVPSVSAEDIYRKLLN